MPAASEHKTHWSRILKYAQEIGWTCVPRDEAERRAIVAKQETLDWGASVIDCLSHDLRKAFPGAFGISQRDLRSIKQLYAAYTNPLIWLQPVARLAKASLYFGDLIDQIMTTQLYVHAR